MLPVAGLARVQIMRRSIFTTLEFIPAEFLRIQLRQLGGRFRATTTIPLLCDWDNRSTLW
jgi:hypothetical protein